jgi:hypothetical protein
VDADHILKKLKEVPSQDLESEADDWAAFADGQQEGSDQDDGFGNFDQPNDFANFEHSQFGNF